MAATPKKADVGEAIPGLGSLPLEKVEYKHLEDEQEKQLRLHKERVSFYVKDLGIWIFGIVFLTALGGYCLWVLASGSANPADKAWAQSTIAPILTGVAGYMFGKAMK